MSLRSFFGRLFGAATGGRSRHAGPFPFERDWATLLAQLGLPPSALRDVVEADSLHPHFHYRHFTKPKKASGRREIAAPDVKLKRVQHEIIARYFRDQQPHSAAVAYRKEKSTADHAWPHAGAEILITADVQDFFPNTQAWRIENWWRERFDDDLARLLTRLTTYRGGLPQGAPTSPGLSNFVNRELDVRLAQRANDVGARYTRYCDDLAFSWRHGTGPPSDFEEGVRALLHEFGYALQPEKGFCVQYRQDEPELVGVILSRDGRVRLPDDLSQTMLTLASSADPHDLQRLAGYRGYEAMIVRRPARRRTPKKVPVLRANPPDGSPF
jgi:RNA-directed DNA polymerase